MYIHFFLAVVGHSGLGCQYMLCACAFKEWACAIVFTAFLTEMLLAKNEEKGFMSLLYNYLSFQDSVTFV